MYTIQYTISIFIDKINFNKRRRKLHYPKKIKVYVQIEKRTIPGKITSILVLCFYFHLDHILILNYRTNRNKTTYRNVC